MTASPSTRCRTLRAVVLLAAAAYATVGSAQSALTDDEVKARTQAVVDWALKRPGAVGLSVAVARAGKMVVEQGAGIADLEFNVPANRETSFRIGSVTKQFTAAAIMKLAEQRKLALDDDIAKYIPEFKSGGRKVTIRQLLNHASGVPNYTAQPDFVTKAAPLDLTHAELLKSIEGVPFDFEPGKGWHYSNTGYYLLGMIIEVVSKRPYATFVKEELFEPLGLTRTFYGSERDIIPNRAQGYAFDPAMGRLSNDAPVSMDNPGAAGALAASAGDLVRWQIALRAGRAVKPESYQTMITSTVPTGQGPQRYGFGLMIGEVDGVKRILHNGGIQGFNSVLMTFPDEELHVAVISNSTGLESELVAGNIVAALHAAVAPPLPELRTAVQPGVEAIVRKMLEGIARGEPDYGLMAKQMASVTRQQLPTLQSRLKELGPIRSITFLQAMPNGMDSFDVQLEKGAILFQILIDADGKVTGAGLRPGTARPTTTETPR
jgi:CubicO group peptidase (beta-lactamase class C family)